MDIKIVAIAGIVALEVANMLTTRIDGAMLMAVITSIGGLAGYTVTKKATRKKVK